MVIAGGKAAGTAVEEIQVIGGRAEQGLSVGFAACWIEHSSVARDESALRPLLPSAVVLLDFHALFYYIFLSVVFWVRLWHAS